MGIFTTDIMASTYTGEVATLLGSCYLSIARLQTRYIK